MSLRGFVSVPKHTCEEGVGGVRGKRIRPSGKVGTGLSLSINELLEAAGGVPIEAT